MNFIKSLLRPVNSTHFGYGNNNWSDSERSCKKSLFSGLSIFLKTYLKFSIFSWNNKNSNVCLTRTHDHISHIISMTWAIKNSEPSFSLIKNKFCILNCNSSQSFCWIDISNFSKFPIFDLIFLLLLFFFLYQLLLVSFVHYVLSKCWFSRVNMPDKNQIYVLFSEYLKICVFICRPFFSQKFIQIYYRFLSIYCFLPFFKLCLLSWDWLILFNLKLAYFVLLLVNFITNILL